MKKYSKKSELTSFTPIAARIELEPQFYLEQKIAALLPPGTMMPISTTRIMQKLSDHNLSSSEIIGLFKLTINEPKEIEGTRQPQQPSRQMSPQLLLTGKLRKKVKRQLEMLL